MTTTPEKSGPPPPRTFRIDESLWSPFLELIAQVEHTGASSMIRRWISEYLNEYRVFWAPEHADIDSAETPIAWYDCVECNMPHRLNGVGAPWGCSVLKARDDRREKEAGAA